MNILKEFISSLLYIFPSQKRINRVILEVSSSNLKSIINNDFNIIKNHLSTSIKLDINRISQKLLHSHDYKNIEKIYTHIKNNIDTSLISIYLTGSYGSDDYVVNWSDVDIVVVINTDSKIEIENIFKILYSLNKFLYRDDIFQHHGFLMLHYSDYYNENRFFPFEILENGLCLYGDNKIIFKASANNVSFKYMKDFYYNNKFNDIKDFFVFKNYIHQITIFPSLYYQSKGTVYYKKDAIEKFILEFPEFKEIFKTTSDIRYKWPLFRLLLTIDMNNIVFLRLSRSLFSRFYYKKLNNLKKEFEILKYAPKLLEKL